MESQHIIAELKQGVSALDFDNKAVNRWPRPDATGETTQLQSADRNSSISYARRNGITPTLNCKCLTGYWFTCKCSGIFGIFAGRSAKVTDREKAGEAYDKITQESGGFESGSDYVIHQRHRVLTLVTNQSVEELDPSINGSDALRDIKKS